MTAPATDQPAGPASGATADPTTRQATAQPLIRLRDAVVAFGRRRGRTARALDGVDFDVLAGQSVALLGPNGSGKSTLLGVLAGTVALTHGRLERRASLRLGVVFQSPALDRLLTVRENLRVQAALFGGGVEPRRIERLASDMGLDDHLDRPVRTLSGGLVRRTEFVRAILAEPQVLLLDEATAGLDLPARAALLGAVESMRAQFPDRAVVMSTHLLDEAERCTQVVMLSQGRVVCQGEPGALVAELGPMLLGVPAGVDRADLPDIEGLAWKALADGTQVARAPSSEALAAWSDRLARAQVPFFVRPPTLADAYLLHAGRPLEGGR
ncbi:MAG: ABC transporter [Phycisphaerales bacterium]|nr:MAG: ABC transporter [Phycisphaerales bacterium]